MRLPVIVYSWPNYDLQEHCSIDMLLLAGTTNEQIKVKINKNCMGITVSYSYPLTFLSASRLTNLSDGVFNESHAKTTALAKAIIAMREARDMDDVVADFKIKLPFKVEDRFSEQPVIGMYPHEEKKYSENNQMYYILHIELVAAAKPREITTGVNACLVARPHLDKHPKVDAFSSNKKAPMVEDE